MRAIRTLTFLHRLVLVWFVLSLGAAVASPIVNPVQYEMICSGSAVKFISVVDGEATDIAAPMSMDCPLCVMTSAPPPPAGLAVVGDAPPLLQYATRSIPAARIAAATAAPLPARGPPLNT